MKRAAVLGVLVLCVAGLLWLLLDSSRDRALRRSGDAASHSDTTRSDAQTPTSEAAAKTATGTDDDPNRVPGPDVTVRGRVLRGTSGIAGATVLLERAPPRGRSALRTNLPMAAALARTATDEQGGFSLTTARRSVVVVHAHAPGAAHKQMRLLIPAEGDPEPFDIWLEDERRLAGLVVDANDEPVADAEVRLARRRTGGVRLELETATDTGGRFLLERLPGAQATLDVAAAGYGTARRYVNLARAEEIKITLAPGGVVFGKVTDSRDGPIAGARLTMTTRDPRSTHMGTAQGTTGDSGEYRLENVAQGFLMSLQFSHPGFPLGLRGAGDLAPPAEQVKTGKELRFDIVLPAGQPVHGVVVVAGSGAPVANASVTLLAMAQGWRGMADAAKTVADKNGKFRFEHVPTGSYAIEASSDGFARFATRTPGTRQPMTIDFHLDEETPPPPQRVELDPAGAARGRILGVDAGPNTRTSIYSETETGRVQGYVDDLLGYEIPHLPVAKAARLKTWSPTAESEPFDVEAGVVATVDVDAANLTGFRGVVVDEGGQPIQGAFVMVRLETERGRLGNLVRRSRDAATTGPDGTFRIVPPEWDLRRMKGRKLTLGAAHPDFASTLVEGLELPADGSVHEQRVVLRRGSVVAGRVEHEDGTPAAEIYLFLNPSGEAEGVLRQARNASSRSDGSFEFTGVEPGEYTVSAWESNSTAEPVKTEAGVTDVRVVLRPVLAIRGLIRDEEGRIVRNARVFAIVATADGERRQAGAIDDGTGLFQVRLEEPGSYALEAEPRQQSWGAVTYFEKTRVDPVATGTTDVVIVVSRGAKVSGTVVGPDGKGVAGAGVVAAPLQIDPKQSRAASQQSRPAAITNGRGEFEIPGVPREELELIAIATGYALTTRRTTGGEERVALRLEPGGKIEGTVLDESGQPLRGAWVSFRPEDEQTRKLMDSIRTRGGQTLNAFGGWQTSGARTGDDGEFRIEGLLPGAYRVSYLSETGARLPEEVYRTGAAPYTIRLATGLTIRGVVKDAEGGPVTPKKGQVIWITAWQGSKTLRGVSANADGTFEIVGLPSGVIQLQVWAGSPYLFTKVDVQAGSQEVEIAMKKSAG